MDKEIFVQNVKKYCGIKGVKPTNACKESGVGGSFLSDINRGQTPSVTKVQRLANYLGVTTSELLGEPIPGIAEIAKALDRYKIEITMPANASPEAKAEAKRLEGMNFLDLFMESSPEAQWTVIDMAKGEFPAGRRTTTTRDELSEEQVELVRLFRAAPPALRAAALAVLRSAGGQEQTSDRGHN